MTVRKLCANGHHTLIFNVNERIPENYIESNKTIVDWSIQLETSQNYGFQLIGSTITAYINGTKVYDVYAQRNAENYATVTWASGSLEIEHNNDGKKTINFSCSYSQSSTSNWTPGNASLDGSLTLKTIPRATTCPNLNGYIESSYNIPLNPASNTFTHSLKVTFGNIDKYINSNGTLQTSEYKFTNSNIPFTIPNSFYDEFTGKYKTGTLTLKTYSGNTHVGTKTGVLTANCNETKCRPSISGTLKDINETTIALTGNVNKVIKGFSTLQANLTLSASSTSGDHSTISTRTINNKSFTGTSPTITKATSKSVTITVTNSRGFSNSKTISTTGELIDYFAPQINVNPYRVEQTSANVKLTYSGKFFNKTFGSVVNTLTMRWYYKEENASSWTLGGDITPTFNTNNIVEATIDCGTIYDYRKNYRFKVEAVDKLSSNIQEQTVTAGIPNHDWGKNHFQHHTPVYDLSGNEFLGFHVIREIPD